MIVDNYLTYDDVLNYFKISEYPADRIFVNEQWIADCIHFRFLVEPDQIQYDVDGFPRHSRPRSTVSARAPEGSMQPESREEKLTSPPESHERRPKNFLDPQAGSPEAFVVRPFSAVEAGTTRNIARDALDKAIEATQLVASLVSTFPMLSIPLLTVFSLSLSMIAIATVFPATSVLQKTIVTPLRISHPQHIKHHLQMSLTGNPDSPACTPPPPPLAPPLQMPLQSKSSNKCVTTTKSLKTTGASTPIEKPSQP